MTNHRSPDTVALLALFQDHYWDSLEPNKDLVMAHVRSVLAMHDVAQSTVPTFPAALEKVFEDHYWDTFNSDRDLIMQHVRAVLRQYEISTAIARAHLTPVSSTPQRHIEKTDGSQP